MDIIKDISDKIPKRIKICFMSGVIFGFFTHIIMLSNKLPNWDDLGNYHAYGVGGEFGRWLLRFLHPWSGTWSNPWINGGLTILILAVAFCLFYEGLGLRSITSAVLFPMIFMTFPSLSSTMTYMFTMDLYAVGILLSALSFYLVRRYSLGFLFGIIPLILSMGLYQSYICFTISAMLATLLIDSLKEENTFGKLIKRGIAYASTLLLSTVFYYVIAILRFPQLLSIEHNGIGSMGHVSLLRIPKLIAKAYLRFANYFLIGGYSFQTAFIHICNILITIILVVLFILIIREKQLYKQKGNFIFALLCIFLFPLGMSFVDIMAPDSNFSLLMIYQYAFFYTAVLILCEQLTSCGQKLIRFTSLAGILLVILTGFKDYQITNEAYFRMEMTYERVYAYLNRIMSRIESMEGYQSGDPIMLVGTFDQTKMHGYLLDEEKFYDFSGIALEYGLMTPGAREDFIRIFLGASVEFPDETIASEIKDSTEFRGMAVYPSSGAIKKIGERWVVKIG